VKGSRGLRAVRSRDGDWAIVIALTPPVSVSADLAV
jgi:hypothetical protein